LRKILLTKDDGSIEKNKRVKAKGSKAKKKDFRLN